MRLSPFTMSRRTATLAAACVVAAAATFLSPASLAAQAAPTTQPAVRDANAGSGGSTGRDANDDHAKPSHPNHSSMTDDVRLRIEIYTGNDYSK